MAGEGADRDPVAVLAHVAQIVEPADVDEHRGACKAKTQHRDQRVPAGEDLRVLAAPSSSIASSSDRRARTRTRRESAPAPSPPPRTALTMLWYPVQRQRLPSRPSRISSSDGLGFSLSSETAAMTKPRRAEAALERVLLVERLLHRVQLVALGEPLDRRDLAAVGLHGEHGARLHRLAVEQHGARPAGRRVAADVRAREPELVAQEVHEQLPRLDVRLVPLHR